MKGNLAVYSSYFLLLSSDRFGLSDKVSRLKIEMAANSAGVLRTSLQTKDTFPSVSNRVEFLSIVDNLYDKSSDITSEWVRLTLNMILEHRFDPWVQCHGRRIFSPSWVVEGQFSAKNCLFCQSKRTNISSLFKRFDYFLS